MGWSVACDRKFQTLVLVESGGLVACSSFVVWRDGEEK
jgi:hypothetical protein